MKHWVVIEKKTLEFVRGTVRKPYKFHNFLIDLLMTIFTEGLWIIWVLVREFKRR